MIAYQDAVHTVSVGIVICLFFPFFPVVIKPEDPYFASRPGLKVNPLGVYPLGPRSSSYQRYTTAQRIYMCYKYHVKILFFFVCLLV